MTNTVEANFDGLVGPTHNYAGLSYGNVASARNMQQASNPREAARQGLAKMKALHDLGLAQGVLLPHERPHLPTLRRLGFRGNDAAVLRKAAQQAPHLLAAASSASAMWAANAATVSPSADTADHRVHFTPANLGGNLHRAIETSTTARMLKAIFADVAHFIHHRPLPTAANLGDEGAANHTRLCWTYGAPGLELFVFGRGDERAAMPARFPARQTRAASEAIARLHRLDAGSTHFTQQNPAAIDAGAFHNDVVAVGNREVLLHHEQAYLDTGALRDWIAARLHGATPAFLEVPASEVPLEEAVTSYLFNSQLVCPPQGGMLMIVAQECRENPRVWACLQRLVAEDNPLTATRVFDLRQSMRNGGGPACLRLRVVLTASERAAVHRHAWLDEKRYAALVAWVDRHYRDRLAAEDLADPQLLDESRTALDRLTKILRLPSLYEFQR